MEIKDELDMFLKGMLRLFLIVVLLGSGLIIIAMIQYIFEDYPSTKQINEDRLKLLLWIIPMSPVIIIAYLVNEKILKKEQLLKEKDLSKNR